MSEVRLNFLNFQPDREDFQNDGLSVAQNVIHEPEGFKPVHLGSAGAFSTTGGLGVSVGTITSIVSKPVGAQGDTFSAWITGGTGINVGLNGVTATSNTTGYPLSFSTAGPTAEIVAFDVCEFADKIYFVVEAQQTQAVPSTTVGLRFSAYMDY